MDTKTNDPSKARGTIYDATRTVLLAAIGAAALAQEELTGFVDRLVDRGEMAEADARKLVREIIERREKLENERKQQEKKSSGASTVTKDDIQTLVERIAELSSQIEELKHQQGK
jgi:polyhydroxyalkanoate synthesis regulator phasin